MPKYVIERDVPGAGKLSAAELHGISQKSCGVLKKLGAQFQCVQSYVTDDKLFACTSRLTRRSYASTPSRVDFQPIESPNSSL